MFTEFKAQVGFYDFLPCLAGQGFFRGMSQCILDFPEALTKRLREQVVLAPKCLLEPPWVKPGSFMTAETAAPFKPSARTRREASLTIFRWISGLCSAR
jgi:hypothetical protein